MEQGQLNWIANFIWGIAYDVLRDLFHGQQIVPALAADTVFGLTYEASEREA